MIQLNDLTQQQRKNEIAKGSKDIAIDKDEEEAGTPVFVEESG